MSDHCFPQGGLCADTQPAALCGRFAVLFAPGDVALGCKCFGIWQLPCR